MTKTEQAPEVFGSLFPVSSVSRVLGDTNKPPFGNEELRKVGCDPITIHGDNVSTASKSCNSRLEMSHFGEAADARRPVTDVAVISKHLCKLCRDIEASRIG